MAKLTKQQIIDMCREVFREYPETFRGDIPAKREYFNNFTDSMCKDKMITLKQYETWTNPF